MHSILSVGTCYPQASPPVLLYKDINKTTMPVEPWIEWNLEETNRELPLWKGSKNWVEGDASRAPSSVCSDLVMFNGGPRKVRSVSAEVDVESARKDPQKEVERVPSLS